MQFRTRPVTRDARTYQAAHLAASAYQGLISANSRRALGRALGAIAAELGDDMRHVPWHLFRPDDTRALRPKLMAAYSATTVSLALSALESVLQEALRLGLLDTDG